MQQADLEAVNSRGCPDRHLLMDPPSTLRTRRRLWVGLLVFCAPGLAVAIQLALVHVHAHLDPATQSFCAISEGVNCDTVARSRYSVFLRVPVAAWGIYGYLVMLGVAL